MRVGFWAAILCIRPPERTFIRRPGDDGTAPTMPISPSRERSCAPDYMLTLVERGADLLAAARRISVETATALKAEAQRRVEAGTFFGFLAYASLLVRRPAA